ncbi:MAG: preprotein translocase subunit YajC [Gammaproteobacteria bacterium]|nr:preprotein translocase subunit YajC [Gammaproteobacteria bacterium]
MNLFFSTAHAQGAAQQPSLTFNFILFGGLILMFWLLLIRPQSKRAKEHRELVASIDKGDEIMTSGGLLGKVTKVSGEYMLLQVASGVEIKLQKTSVAAALPKGTLEQI